MDIIQVSCQNLLSYLSLKIRQLQCLMVIIIEAFLCSLFNSIDKLLDFVIIDICGDSLSTSDMQYGYKNNHSTTIPCVTL